MILYTEADNKMQQSEADKVLGILCAAYPGHPWAVRVGGGVIFIRHLQFGSNWGMNIKWADVSYDSAVLKKKVIMLAGEWLERAGLTRGRENGDEILRVDGVPDRYQPRSQKPPVQVLIDATQPPPTREEARPQALNEGDSNG